MRRPFKITLFLAPLFLVSAREAQPSPDLVAHLTKLESEHSTLCAATANGSDLLTRINLLVSDLHSRPGIMSGGPEGIAALSRFIFQDLGIQASRNLEDPCNLLPTAILERRQGYCVGIAALYLALAERLNLPVFAVATPSHVFLRFDDGDRRINIETQQGGANVPDERYVQEMKIPARSIRNGVFLRNLTPDEFLAQVHNNLGVIYSKRRDYGSAAGEYERALDLDPWLPAAWYNYGKDLFNQREFRSAARLFSKALRLYPTDIWALNNRGIAWCNLGKPERARQDFARALELDPSFTLAAQNLSDGPCASTVGGD